MSKIEDATQQTPQALLERPYISDFTAEFVDAFTILAQTRSIGFVPGPIQLSEIKAYIDLYGSPSMSIPIFIRLILRMDRAYLEVSNKPVSSKKVIKNGR